MLWHDSKEDFHTLDITVRKEKSLKSKTQEKTLRKKFIISQD